MKRNITMAMEKGLYAAPEGLEMLAETEPEIEIEIKQPGSGGPYTFALPASFKALGGSDTAIATSANAVTVLSAKTFDNGTTWRYVMQESAA